MSKSIDSVYVDILIRGTCMQLTTICRSKMFVAVDAGDRSAEMDQVSIGAMLC